MDKYLNNEEPRNIKGTIFICNELCNLTFDYLDSRGMKLNNVNNILSIDYNKGSVIKYNGGESFGSKDSRYQIKTIRVLAPNLHYIQDKSHKMELIISHLSEDGMRYQHICIFLEPSDREDDRKSVTWKLFDKFADQLPTKNQTGKEVTDLVSWNATDLLPDESDRSFYTYNMNKKHNFIVFMKPTFVPNAFYSNLIKDVIEIRNFEKLSEITMPRAPPQNIPIFAKKNVVEDPSMFVKRDVDGKCDCPPVSVIRERRRVNDVEVADVKKDVEDVDLKKDVEKIEDVDLKKDIEDVDLKKDDDEKCHVPSYGWGSYLAGFLIILVLIGIGIWIYWYFTRERPDVSIVSQPVGEPRTMGPVQLALSKMGQVVKSMGKRLGVISPTVENRAMFELEESYKELQKAHDALKKVTAENVKESRAIAADESSNTVVQINNLSVEAKKDPTLNPIISLLKKVVSSAKNIVGATPEKVKVIISKMKDLLGQAKSKLQERIAQKEKVESSVVQLENVPEGIPNIPNDAYREINAVQKALEKLGEDTENAESDVKAGNTVDATDSVEKTINSVSEQANKLADLKDTTLNPVINILKKVGRTAKSVATATPGRMINIINNIQQSLKDAINKLKARMEKPTRDPVEKKTNYNVIPEVKTLITNMPRNKPQYGAPPPLVQPSELQMVNMQNESNKNESEVETGDIDSNEYTKLERTAYVTDPEQIRKNDARLKKIVAHILGIEAKLKKIKKGTDQYNNLTKKKILLRKEEKAIMKRSHNRATLVEQGK